MKLKLFFVLFLIFFISCNIPTDELTDDEKEPDVVEPRNTITGKVETYQAGKSVQDVRIIATSLDPLNPELSVDNFKEQGIAITEKDGTFKIDRNVSGDELPGGNYKVIAGIMNWKDTLSMYVNYNLLTREVEFPEITVTNLQTVALEEPIQLKRAIPLEGIRINEGEFLEWDEGNMEDIPLGVGDSITFYWGTPNPEYTYAFLIAGTAHIEENLVIYQNPSNLENALNELQHTFVNEDENGDPILISGTPYRWLVIGTKNTQGNFLMLEATISEIFMGDFRIAEEGK